ncbi:hypothetical protein L1Z01_09985 [Acinetobacter baumannii]|uniref:hypothetical protein n=1 Tax=Acinetobacter baumannii TaxID=470 RepID=UPI0022B5D2E6|nr:hypothetical protein [Acinetobacter baumannii]MCF4428881.1 hypothetical protein [Acinetobacter baumannii]MCF4451098.1 hypothetical protein [Acinetobacter baumannii]MCF4488788.1 hypothetical protein [Acinetobacter baumannii]MCF4529836.1 hypothetical protein [Acinetobacter baumannii]MCF4539071.1 hypothetical protein [Acinetobacter baumannii]
MSNQEESNINLSFEQDNGAVWVFAGDSQFGTEISHLMMMHADEYNEDELRVICNHAACEIDRLRAELEKAKAQAVPVWISADIMKPDEGDLVLGISTTKLAKFNVYQVVALDEFDECAINYWMPLPKAPSESGAEG